jgi:hypothetical protein
LNEIVLTLVVVGLALVEIGLLLSMNQRYFSIGIPLFRKRVSVGLTSNSPPDTEFLFTRFSKSAFVPFLFKRYTSTRYGFREGLTLGGLLKLNYPPIVHGQLVFDRASSEVVATGYANIWMCALILSLAKDFVTLPNPLIAIFFMALVSSCFWIQLRRFAQVAAVAAEKWSSPTEAEVGGA